MAFRGIGGSLQRRRTVIVTASATSPDAAGVVRAFLQEAYGKVRALECAVGYADATVTIRTGSRKIADDIILRSAEISAVVRAAQFPLKRIVVG